MQCFIGLGQARLGMIKKMFQEFQSLFGSNEFEEISADKLKFHSKNQNPHKLQNFIITFDKITRDLMSSNILQYGDTFLQYYNPNDEQLKSKLDIFGKRQTLQEKSTYAVTGQYGKEDAATLFLYLIDLLLYNLEEPLLPIKIVNMLIQFDGTSFD